MGPPCQFALNKTFPVRPNIGFTICLPPIPFPWVGQPEGHLYLAPPGQCLSKCWSEPSCLRGHRGETRGLVLLVASLIRCCPETEICAAPIRIVGASGGFAGLVLLLSKCLVAGIPRLIGSSRGEGISFVDRESL